METRVAEYLIAVRLKCCGVPAVVPDKADVAVGLSFVEHIAKFSRKIRRWFIQIAANSAVEKCGCRKALNIPDSEIVDIEVCADGLGLDIQCPLSIETSIGLSCFNFVERHDIVFADGRSVSAVSIWVSPIIRSAKRHLE